MPNRPLLLGHRGARGDRSVAENSPASFDLALAGGCDGFELDVRLSGDGQPVICHDAVFQGREVDRCSAQQLSLPLLSEVLRRYCKSAYLDIELKVEGMEGQVLELLRRFPLARGGMISSFLPEVLMALRNSASPLPLGLICETKAQFRVWPKLKLGCAVLHRNLMNPEVLSQARDEGSKVFVWTVNAPREMRRFAEWGVDGIISDYPGRLAGVFEK
jgi:glycerophosphoryl diester phosphodiesterase